MEQRLGHLLNGASGASYEHFGNARRMIATTI